MSLLTVQGAAELLSRLEPTRDLPSAYFSRQVREIVQRGYVKPLRYRGSGRTAAALFDADRVCLADLISTFIRFGMQTSHVADVQACIGNVDDRTGPWSYALGGLPTNVSDGIRHREIWFFKCWTEPLEGTGGLGSIRGSFRATEPFRADDAWSPLKRGVPTFVINVTQRWAPIFDAPELAAKPEPATAAE